MFGLNIVIGISAGVVLPLIWAMYADILDYSEWKTGRRATGLIFSSSSMSQKMGWTLGGALAGWVLGAYGFEANAEQSEESLQGIRLMLSFYPAIGALLSAIFIYFYNLNEKFMKKVGVELEAKR
jgi:glycoside/pentoside/hexuronide:cation symporter, GPH family